MIAKLCRPMKKSRGGAGKGAVEYLVGYAIAEKGASAQEVRDALEGVYAEAAMRDDLGCGGADGWSPAAGGGVRPSSVRVINGCALEAVGSEIDADAMMVPGVSSSTLHLVFSLPTAEGQTTDAQMHRMVDAMLGRMGLSEHRALVAIHRDTLVRDGDGRIIDGNLHAHVAVGSINPRTMAAYDRVGVHQRLAWAARETEIEFGISHDRGLAVVRDAGTEHERVEWADYTERLAWKKTELSDRLAQSVGAVIDEGEGWERTANATIAPRLIDATISAPMGLSREEEAAWQWSEAHVAAARFGARLEAAEGGKKDVWIVRESDGERASWREAVGSSPAPYMDALSAENVVMRTLDARPSIVAEEIARSQSTFGAGEIHGWMQRRISSADDRERIAERVIADPSVVALAVDSATPLYATRATAQAEAQMMEDATAVAARTGIDGDTMERAIRGARLSDEQAAALRATTRAGLAVVEGAPGAGKTSMMRALAEAARADGRSIVGITIAQDAARNLASEAGMPAINSARMMAEERRGAEIVPRGGVVVIDEAGMVDSNTMKNVMRLARERDASVVLIGDTAQLRPIAAGDAMDALRPVAAQRGAAAEVRTIHRQKNSDHAEAVGLLRSAIAERDDVRREQMTVRSVRALDRAGMIQMHETRKSAMEASAQEIGAARRSGKAALLLDAGRDGTRLQNESMREALGIRGGIARRTDGGAFKKFAIGDEVKITKNGQVAVAARGPKSDGGEGYVAQIDGRGVAIPTKWASTDQQKKAEVVNGDIGRVVRVDGRGMDVAIRGGETVHLPAAYRHIDHGYARTIHASQGQTVDIASAVADRGTSAEAALVAVSRAREQARIHVSGYGSIDEYARDLAKKIEPMRTTTAAHVAEIVAQTGGRQTMRVVSMQRAAERLSVPERAEYLRAVVQPIEAQKSKIIEQARERYESAGRSPDALRAMRQEIARASHLVGPSPAAWAAERASLAPARRPERSLDIPQQRRQKMAIAARKGREHRAMRVMVGMADTLRDGRAVPDLLRRAATARPTMQQRIARLKRGVIAAARVLDRVQAAEQSMEAPSAKGVREAALEAARAAKAAAEQQRIDQQTMRRSRTQ